MCDRRVCSKARGLIGFFGNTKNVCVCVFCTIHDELVVFGVVIYKVCNYLGIFVFFFVGRHNRIMKCCARDILLKVCIKVMLIYVFISYNVFFV